MGRIFSTLRSFQTQPIRRPSEVQNRRRSSLIQLSLLCLRCIQYPTAGDFRTTSKMRDNILLTYVIVDLLFVVSGGLLLIFALETESMTTDAPTVTTVARNLLLMQCPLSGPSSNFIKIENGFNKLVAAIGNAVLIFVTFLVSVPAMVMPMTRGWLKLHGYMVVVCAVFTLILGLSIWFETLKTRSRLATIWNNQPAATQSLIQQEVGY